jgi:hypothetical protein
MSTFIQRRLSSGQTMRYHTVPNVGNGQNVAAHCWRAMVLLHSLWPEASHKALLHVLYHDAAEQTLGDIPAPAKWAWPELRAVYQQAEEEMHHDLEVLQVLTEEEKLMCRIVDMLECVDHVGNRIIQGDRSLETKTVYWNGRKMLRDNYEHMTLFSPARKYMAHLHTQVLAACPEID